MLGGVGVRVRRVNELIVQLQKILAVGVHVKGLEEFVLQHGIIVARPVDQEMFVEILRAFALLVGPALLFDVQLNRFHDLFALVSRDVRAKAALFQEFQHGRRVEVFVGKVMNTEDRADVLDVRIVQFVDRTDFRWIALEGEDERMSHSVVSLTDDREKPVAVLCR